MIPLHGRQEPVAILVDTGCSDSGIAQSTARALRVPRRRLRRPKYASLADGSTTKITHFTTLDIIVGSFKSKWQFDIMPGTLEPDDFLLGMDWLTKHNPKISFRPLAMQIAHNGKQHQILAKRPPKAFCADHGYAHHRAKVHGHGRRNPGRNVVGVGGMFGLKAVHVGESKAQRDSLTEDDDQGDLSAAVWVDWKEVFPEKSWLPDISREGKNSSRHVAETKSRDREDARPTRNFRAERHEALESSRTLPVRSSKNPPGKFDLFR